MTTLRVGEEYLIDYGYGVEKVRITKLFDNGVVQFMSTRPAYIGQQMPAERFVSRIRSAQPKEVQELTI
jgi:hypothetical protein